MTLIASRRLSYEDARQTIETINALLEQGLKLSAAYKTASEQLGIARTTIIHRAKPKGICERLYNMRVGEKPEPDYEAYFEHAQAERDIKSAPVEVSAIERHNQRLQDENKELRRRLQDTLRQANADDAILQILGGVVAKPVDPPKWLIDLGKTTKHVAEVPVTMWSDWHASEVVSLSETNGVNAFDHEILDRRVRRLVERTMDLCKNHGSGKYPGIVINLVGDFVSGALHPELLANDEEEVIPTVLRVRDLLVWALGQMADAFGSVYCPCVSGNHGRSTHKPEFKRYVFKNFDWLIYQLLARHFEKDARIVFDIPDSNEVHYRVFGMKYLLMHGDMLGSSGGDGIIGVIGPIMRGDAKVGRQSSAIGLNYDVLLIGHWHQQLWLPRIICANSLKGFDEYAKLKLRATPSTPSQPLWFVHPKWGRTVHRDVLLEDPGYATETEWVNFRAQATRR